MSLDGGIEVSTMFETHTLESEGPERAKKESFCFDWFERPRSSTSSWRTPAASWTIYDGFGWGWLTANLLGGPITETRKGLGKSWVVKLEQKAPNQEISVGAFIKFLNLAETLKLVPANVLFVDGECPSMGESKFQQCLKLTL